jgi:hypothetical protein
MKEGNETSKTKTRSQSVKEKHATFRDNGVQTLPTRFGHQLSAKHFKKKSQVGMRCT